MALDGIKDRNAQRVEGAAGLPMLSSGGQVGQHQNASAESLGTQDVSSAVRTAQALGTLAQDLVGNAQAIQQKEQFVEAYANAGAGRSVAEIRKEAPAWTTIFGPSATVQGAQARALQTAVANFGNEGLAMVEQHKDKDPAEFHKMLAGTVKNHLTGDAITDQLITQKAIESTTEIAAAQYKLHAKYTQELNVQAATNSVNAEIGMLKAHLALPKDAQSPEGIARARQSLESALRNTHGMDAISHQTMIVGIMNNELEQGSAIVRDILMPSLAPSIAQSSAIHASTKVYDKGVKAERTAKVEGDAARAALGVAKQYPDIQLTAEEELAYATAVEKGNAYIANKHRDARAAGRVHLIEQAEKGVDELTLFKGIHALEKQTGPLSEGEIKEIIGTHMKKAEGTSKTQEALNNYIAGNEDSMGEQAYHEGLRQRNPGMKGEIMVLQDIVRRNQPTPNKVVSYQYDSNLGLPTLPDGKPNPNFLPTFTKFQEHFKMNPENALRHITNPDIRKQVMVNMRAIQTGGATPESVVKNWQPIKPVSEQDVLHNEQAKEGIAKAIKNLSADHFWNPWGIIKKKTKITPYVESVLAQGIANRMRAGNIDYETAAANELLEFEKTNESIGGFYHQNNGVPFTTKMGLIDKKVDADTVLEHYKNKLKLQHTTITSGNGNFIIQPTTKAGFSKGDPIVISYKELGNIYNTEVTQPARDAVRAVQGQHRDERLTATLSALKWRAQQDGHKDITDDEVYAMYNAEQARKKQVMNKAKAVGTAVGNHYATTWEQNKKDMKTIPKVLWNGLKSLIPGSSVRSAPADTNYN